MAPQDGTTTDNEKTGWSGGFLSGSLTLSISAEVRLLSH